ncbi:hypothetical protein COEREDRAFT_88101 [Coemansia reversa NRRL 1564]|uniref:GATA-type domain-containing protein n=1 Tax=Coemansia reversa (strain ATCC 12441 / NRRL 1564) TaxID=763665 RepID=A0A2G5B952_COERN|nr:hypothetical protein COEREDRAFT_88101 [Coemansia reversa NRRL 1564]|eukprot:PIA15257.1 hypothetical protein COEREDRAFT_88101 [Coemansia reversa NRRL 1564]
MSNIGGRGFYMSDVKDNQEETNFVSAMSSNRVVGLIARDTNGLITPNDSFLSLETSSQILTPFDFSSPLSSQSESSQLSQQQSQLSQQQSQLSQQQSQLSQQLTLQSMPSTSSLFPPGIFAYSANNQTIPPLPYYGGPTQQFDGIGEFSGAGLSIYHNQQLQQQQQQQQIQQQQLQQLQQIQQLQQQQEHEFHAPLLSQQGMFFNTTKVKTCSICGVCETPTWRRHPLNGACVCNACGLYYKLHKRDREFTVNARGQRVVRRQPRGAARRAQLRDRELGALQLISNTTVDNTNSVPASSVNASLFGNYL